MLDTIPILAEQWRERRFTDAEFATLYFLYWQIHKHGIRFAARKSRHYSKLDVQSIVDVSTMLSPTHRTELLVQMMERYHYLGVIPAVSITLAEWLMGHWPLQLCDYIPTPEQVLALQVDGIRPVTVLAEYPRLLQPVLAKHNAFEFMLHDLEHAYKFYHDSDSHHEQRALFTLLQFISDLGMFSPYSEDPQYAHKLDYLLSDMNTRAGHALQYLRAMFVDYLLIRDGKQWFEPLSTHATDELRAWVARLVEEGDFTPAQQQLLDAFFTGHYNDALMQQLVTLVKEFSARLANAKMLYLSRENL